MLGDQAQKPKNSFKAIRRRRKTVTFSEPTYVDYSDFDYSTDDEDIEELFGTHSNGQEPKQGEDTSQQDNGTGQEDESTEQNVAERDTDETAQVEPLKTRGAKDDTSESTAKAQSQEEAERKESEESVDDRLDAPSRSRNGTVRNTDSFFKDDSVETKKITLTPNLLRDDSNSRPSTDSTEKEGKSKSSFDKFDRELVSDKEKKKSKDKDKKDKDKKSGGLRGFFSRKDKKRTPEDDDESFGKRSMDMMSDSVDGEDRVLMEQASPERTASQRQGSKLQKTAPSAKSGAMQKPVELSSYLADSRTNDVSNVPPASMRIVHPDGRDTQETAPNQPQRQGSARDKSDKSRERAGPAVGQKEEKSVMSRIVPTRSLSNGQEPKPQKTTKAKTRMELDASDSSEGEDEPAHLARSAETAHPTKEQLRKEPARSLQGTSAPLPAGVAVAPQPQQINTEVSNLQENGGHADRVSPVSVTGPPALVGDESTPDFVSPEASPSPEHMRGEHIAREPKEPSWDDSKLRAFFDESEHIRDLLVIVHDKSDVEPVGADHPVVSGLFREQNAKLAEITTVSLYFQP